MATLSHTIAVRAAVAAKKDKGWSFEDESEDDDGSPAQEIKQLPHGEGVAPGKSLYLVNLNAAVSTKCPSNSTETCTGRGTYGWRRVEHHPYSSGRS